MIAVSHRGPYRFEARAGDGFATRRGAGGVVSALGPLLAGREHTVWVAAAMSDDDRAAVSAGAAQAEGMELEMLVLDPVQHRLHYDIVSNGVLWFLHHGLFDLARRPRFDRRLYEAWDAYVAVNEEFARTVVADALEGEIVLVQDYQLALVPELVCALRPDLRVVHFTHTPFCGPNSIRVLPEPVARRLCSSMASVPSGFHTERWARAFAASAREVLGPDAPQRAPFAASFGPDHEELAETAASPEVATALAHLDEVAGDRRLVVRSDRMELSKNIVRGFQAFDLMLEEHPDCRERVVFVAMLNPSREGLPEYLAYRQEVETAADRVNNRWARGDWTPVVLDTRDDYSRSVAGLVRSDVLLVNPIKDGLNLVAKEGPLVNRRDGVLCLSREAGAFDELREACVEVQPFDLVQTAGALHRALTMPADERARRARRLRELAGAQTPEAWLEAQVGHANATG